MSSLDKFVTWMTESQFNLNADVEIKFEGAHGISVFAKKDLKDGTPLFSIPNPFVLKWENSAINKTALQAIRGELKGWDDLIATMMYENSLSGSIWRPYLDVLPQKISTPLFWNAEQLKKLAGTSVEQLVGVEEIEANYQKFAVTIKPHLALFGDEKYCTLEEYKRLGSIIMAYSFTDEQDQVAMMPMADMLNHMPAINNARLYYPEPVSTKKGNKKVKLEDTMHTMRTVGLVKQGEELYNTYGDLPNGELLRRYGFVVGDNPFDAVAFDVELIVDALIEASADRKEAESRRDQIVENGLVAMEEVIELAWDVEELEEGRFKNAGNVEFPSDLMLFIEVFGATKDNFEAWLKEVQHKDDCCTKEGCEHDHEHHGEEAKEAKEASDEEDEEMTTEEMRAMIQEKMRQEEEEEDEADFTSRPKCEPAEFDRLMKAVLEKRLSLFETTTEVDEKESQSEDAVEKNCAIFRLGEKKILKKALLELDEKKETMTE